ncbi:hypothetical protein FACS1894216_21540 [Synergistales bacterium]|nr:hypothetical protein FACS1894216_21540 [Synergistales bacterium]
MTFFDYYEEDVKEQAESALLIARTIAAQLDTDNFQLVMETGNRPSNGIRTWCGKFEPVV